MGTTGLVGPSPYARIKIVSPCTAGFAAVTGVWLVRWNGRYVPPLMGITGAYCVNVMGKGAEGLPVPSLSVTLFAMRGVSTGIWIVIWLPLFGGLILNAVLPPIVTVGLVPRFSPLRIATSPGQSAVFPVSPTIALITGTVGAGPTATLHAIAGGASPMDSETG